MKKVVYETGRGWIGEVDDLNCIYTSGFEAKGYHVVLSKDDPEKPEIERCEIHCDARLPIRRLVYHRLSRESELWPFVSEATSDPYFAGFEFKDGGIESYPWRFHNRLLDPRDRIIEHAKYVLFRKEK